MANNVMIEQILGSGGKTAVEKYAADHKMTTKEVEAELLKENIEPCVGCGVWSFNMDFNADGYCETCQ